MKDVWIRAAKTFWQTAVGYLLTMLGATLSGMEMTKQDEIITALLGLVVAAIAAGLSAAYNGVIAPWLLPASASAAAEPAKPADIIELPAAETPVNPAEAENATNATSVSAPAEASTPSAPPQEATDA